MVGRIGRWVVWLGLALATPQVARAQASVDAGNEHYQQARLQNGLQVYLAEDHRVPLVALMVDYPTGKALDPRDAPGAAELVARLLPQLGTRHLPDGPSDLLGAAGFYPWSVNAVARPDDTRVSLLVPAAALDLALFLEADRMGFAADGVTTDAVEWGKKRVSEAFTQASGSDRVGLLLKQITFGPAHPYWALGQAPDLAKVDVQWLRERLQRYYGVAGASLSLVGDFESARVLPVVERIFGRLRGPSTPPTPAASPATATATATATAKAELRSSGVYSGFAWAWRTPRYLSDDDITLDVAARYLTHHLSQRLAADGKRSGVSARQVSLPDSSTFWLAVPVPAGGTRASIEAIAQSELDAMAQGKLDAGELAIAKSTIIGDIAVDMDNLGSRSGFLLSYAQLYGKLDGFGPHLATYAQIDGARLAATVKRCLGPGHATLTLVEDPAAKTPVVSQLPAPSFAPRSPVPQVATPDALDWYRPPAALARPRFDPPRIVEASLGKSRLLFMPRSGLPTIKLRVALNWRNVVAVPAVRGLLAQNLLRAKIAGRPILRDRLADLGATLSVGNDRDSLSFTATGLAEQADAIMAALRETFELARFDRDTFKQAREELLKNLAKDESNAWELANHWIERLEYPASHRYHCNDVPDAVRRTVLASIDQAKLEAFWKSERHAEQLTVSIVGPIDDARARALAALGLPKFPPGKPAKTAGLSAVPGLFLVDAPASDGDDVRVQFSWPMPSWGSSGFADALGLRWLFGRAVTDGLEKVLHENGADTVDDWFSNTLAERDQAHLVFAVRVPKAQLAGVLKAVPLYAASLQKPGAISWDTAQEARREALQWVTTNFEGVGGYLSLLASEADFATPASAGSDLYLFAQRIDRASLAKAASWLDPEKASVLAYGRVAGLEQELGATPFGPPRTFGAETLGKAP
jgi:predicted Zn-dependent peptidase